MGCVVVTGGAGCIGSEICKTLRENNILPVTIDSQSDSVRSGPFIRGRIGDRDLIRETFSIYRPSAVIHASAPEESIERPDLIYRTVSDTLVLLEEILEANIPKLLYTSSITTYGSPRTLPLDEEHPQNPLDPYSRSKFTLETIIQDFARAFPLRTAILRCSNTPRIPTAIYGTDYPTPDGTLIRDIIHPHDIATAHLLSLDYLNSHSSLIANIGTGIGHSVRDLLAAAGKPLPEIYPRHPFEPPVLIADNAKARKLLGWSPQHSDLKNLF